jgi:hypothetical protein
MRSLNTLHEGFIDPIEIAEEVWRSGNLIKTRRGDAEQSLVHQIRFEFRKAFGNERNYIIWNGHPLPSLFGVLFFFFLHSLSYLFGFLLFRRRIRFLLIFLLSRFIIFVAISIRKVDLFWLLLKIISLLN